MSHYHPYIKKYLAYKGVYPNLKLKMGYTTPEACLVVGHKGHEPLINQISGGYAPDEILNSLFLPLQKSSNGGQIPKLVSL